MRSDDNATLSGGPRINGYNILVLLAVGMTSINFGYAGNVIGITLGVHEP
jgi:hypothetical protein